MLSALIVISMPVFLGIIFVKPKWGSFLIWPILFMYPHRWWFYNQFLPLNMGADDLFCIFLFLVVVIRRNIFEGVPVRFGYAFWLITSFVIIATIASISGYTYASRVELPLYIKEILKFWVYWGLFYAILHCIDDVHDLRMQFTAISVAAVLGGILVILHYFFPYAIEPFSSPTEEIEYAGRAYGAFMNANAAACVMVCLSIFVVTAVKLQEHFLSKIVIYAFIAVLLLGMMVTRSRAGLMALVGSFLLMAIFGKTKKLAWLVIISATIIALSASDIRELYKERIIETYSPHKTGQFGGVSRFVIWKRYFNTATPQIYILGQGKIQGTARNGGDSTHSAYVDFIVVYGIGGTTWALFGLSIFMRKVLALRRYPEPTLSTVAMGCFWSLIAWGIYGTSASVMGSPYATMLLFYFVVLLDRASALARQQELLAYNEATEMEYEAMPLQVEGGY